MRNAEIISRMTLEEKASLSSGEDFWQTKAIEHLEIDSIFLADGPHGLRKQVAAADHLGLNPSLPATCFPTVACIANSWNEELGERIGAYLGEEAAAQKVNVLLGPGVNMKRNPLCGRNFEYFSEDPYLAGKMAASYIRGIQSKGIAACVKHFCANNQEERRMVIDTIVDERTLREIYLTAFEIAVKEGGTMSVMSSYNKLNGVYTNENQYLLRDILRQEWKFEGVVVTDWGGCNDRVAGLAAGNELEMPNTGGETDMEIVRAVHTGLIKEEVLDECTDRLLNLISKTKAATAGHCGSFDLERHHQMAQTAAEESIVLLKNEDGILPIQSKTKVAVIGDFARHPRYQGAGSSIVNPTKLENTLGCIGNFDFINTGFAPGFERYGKKNSRLIREACSLAAEADLVLLYIGLDEATEVEGIDRKDMKLPQNQIDLIESVVQVNSNLAAVLSCGAPIEMPWIGKIKGLVHAGLSGQAGAGAVLRVLSGEVNPSGKLAETYPMSYETVSSSANFPGMEVGVEYREGPYIGYRYFDTVNMDVLFPFGYGLSYTSFHYSELKIEGNEINFTLKNTGTMAGSEVVQLYIHKSSDLIYRPVKELKGFKKVFLHPGETSTVSIALDDKAFRYYNVVTGAWEEEAGEYEILVSASSRDIRLTGRLERTGTGAEAPYGAHTLPSYFSGKAAHVDLAEFEELLGRKVPDAKWDRNKPLQYNDTIAQCQYAKGWIARFAYRMIMFAHWFCMKTGKRNAANTINVFICNLPFRGIARMTGGIINMPMLDGLLLAVNGNFYKGMKCFIKEGIKWSRHSTVKKKNNGADPGGQT